MALAGACGEGPGGAALPAFAAELPGHTAVVWWGEFDPVAMRLMATLPIERIGLRALPAGPAGVRAWAGPSEQVGWSSLAANQHFVAAARELTPAGAHLFFDLQQTLDAAREALPSFGGGDAQVAGLRKFVEQRVWQALRLDAFEWALVESDNADARVITAVLASGDAARGLLPCLAQTELPAPVPDVPSPALVVAQATLAPNVIAAGIRELIADGSEGPLAALQQFIQGSKLHAAVDALECLDGRVVVATGAGFGFAACGVRDAIAVEAALDTFAVARGAGWVAFGSVHVALDDGVVRFTFGEVPEARQPLDAQPVGLRVAGTAPEFSLTGSRSGGRVRLRVRLP